MSEKEQMAGFDAQMRVLERRWFAAHWAAAAATAELQPGEADAAHAQALERLEVAQYRKRQIMGEIEALEDALIE